MNTENMTTTEFLTYLSDHATSRRLAGDLFEVFAMKGIGVEDDLDAEVAALIADEYASADA